MSKLLEVVEEFKKEVRSYPGNNDYWQPKFHKAYKEDLKQKELLKKLMYVVDGFVEEYKNDNFGNAKEWSRHIVNAYDKYNEDQE